MTFWLNVALLAAAVNVLLLVGMGSVWVRNYRQYGASHTLAFLVFGSFLLIQNVLWLYFYGLHPDFIDWFVNAGTDIQLGLTLLCALETVALVILVRITWS